MKALVVDDSKSMRNIVKAALQHMNIFDEIVEAENGKIALEKIETQGPFDIVFLDWYMPEMEGYDCLVKIRENPKWQDTKIMMVTTENQQENVIKAVMAGANEYLMKPFTPDMLEEKVKMVLGL
ncbi:Chemotaxis two-component response regulator [Dissulfuribacter thermophilus]|uniref:Chemotaxis two-component response regulator n=1 Tax=Dissulfuribacter thermophilus TaxID=1156395 RepID=A0A1B9F9A1_9BACT|nr:response regulator [Dissulfuribacter thermophilus]OCC16488.1 Chemotaxis two-component response regulator [Dissulfuribacter thermophilus]